MPVNVTLADTSNGLLLTTLILYALAMLCYACDFAFAKHRVLADAADEGATVAAPELVAAGAGGPSMPVAPPAKPAPAAAVAGTPAGPAGGDAAASRWPSGFWLRLAFGLTCTGLVLHVFAILTRGLAEHRVPWGNMYEFIGAFTCMAVLVLVAAAVWYRAYYMGLFVLLPVVFGLGIDLTWIYTPAGALVPALQSYWIAIHVTAMIVAIGLFLFGAVVTTLYRAAVVVGRHLGAPARSRHPGPSLLPQRALRVPGLDLRCHGGSHLGGPRLGPVLGLGPEGDVVVHHLGGVRHVPACQGHGRLARPPGCLDPPAWLRLPDVQRDRRQPVDHWPALLRRDELSAWTT
jgi:hypothetical protein